MPARSIHSLHASSTVTAQTAFMLLFFAKDVLMSLSELLHERASLTSDARARHMVNLRHRSRGDA